MTDVVYSSQEIFTALLAARHGYGLHQLDDGSYCLLGASPASPLGNRRMTLSQVALLLARKRYGDDDGDGDEEECPF